MQDLRRRNLPENRSGSASATTRARLPDAVRDAAKPKVAPESELPVTGSNEEAMRVSKSASADHDLFNDIHGPSYHQAASGLGGEAMSTAAAGQLQPP
jgi:hypothetical protein